MKNNDFATNFKDLLKKNRISQKDFAENTGFHVTTVSKWANGHFLPESGTLITIANFFNVTPNELLGKDETEDIFQSFNDTVSPEVMQQLRMIEYIESLGFSVKDLEEPDFYKLQNELKDFISYQFYKINRKDDK